MIEHWILEKIHFAQQQKDPEQEKLARILMGNLQTLRAGGFHDIQGNTRGMKPDFKARVALENILGNWSETGQVHPDEAPRIGALIRTVRRAVGLKQVELAVEAGYHPSFISRIETNTTGRLNMQAVERVCNVLSVQRR